MDEVYNGHDRGLIALGLFWGAFVATFFIWAILRMSRNSNGGAIRLPAADSSPQKRKKSFLTRLNLAVASHARRYLLPDFFRPIFGRTTRLQVLILIIIATYFFIWSCVSMKYKVWVTPVKKHPGQFNTRSSIGSWANRVGLFAYALTPISILLSSRESILTLLTGVPYQKFYFLHRWLGYIIIIQSLIHTVLRFLIDFYFYSPQPATGDALLAEYWMIWGTVAFIITILLFFLSIPFIIRRTGYEFFRKAHYVLALIYMGACIAHWPQLQSFLIAGIVVWFLDRIARLVRTLLLNYKFLDDGSMGFSATDAAIEIFNDPENGDVVRLQLAHPNAPFHPGQHYFLCFTEGNIWQSHPFIPMNAGTRDANGVTPHTYLFRARKGETKKIAELAGRKIVENSDGDISTPVILTGPYGPNALESLKDETNVICVAGGTGITYVLAILLGLPATSTSYKPTRAIELVWVVRHKRDIEWVRPELEILQHRLGLKVRIFTTRDVVSDHRTSNIAAEESKGAGEIASESKEISAASDQSSDVATSRELGAAGAGRPDLDELLKEFIESHWTGPTAVFSSGPGGMISDLRRCVAACNSGSMVWKGEERFDVSLECDDRAEN